MLHQRIDKAYEINYIKHINKTKHQQTKQTQGVNHYEELH